MPVQLNDPEIERFLVAEGRKRGRLSKNATLRLVLTEFIAIKRAIGPTSTTLPSGSDRGTEGGVGGKAAVDAHPIPAGAAADTRTGGSAVSAE